MQKNRSLGCMFYCIALFARCFVQVSGRNPTLPSRHATIYCIFQGKFSAVTWYLGFGMNGFLSYLPCTKKARVAGTTPTVGLASLGTVVALTPVQAACTEMQGQYTGFRQDLYRSTIIMLYYYNNSQVYRWYKGLS